jgi:BASS family bile acid:Na+ symporter
MRRGVIEGEIMSGANVVTQLFLPLSLAIIMLSLGLALVVDDFRRVATAPKAFVVGAFGQMAMLPAVGWLLASLWPMDPALKVGIVILAACPSGATSNLLTHLAKGDTALAVSLTAVISIVSVFTMPVIVSFAIVQFMAVETAPAISVTQTIAGVFLVTNLPVAIGMALRHFAPALALKLETPARHVASVLFVLIVLGAVYSERANIVSYFAQSGLAMLTLNVAIMGLAWVLADVTGLDARQRTAIVIECGLQNGTLAIFVAATLLGSTTMMVPGGIYSLIMFATAGVFMYAVLRRQG